MPQRHSTPIRGLMSTPRSPQFQGRFGRMFRSLVPATFGNSEHENIQNLTALGGASDDKNSRMSALFDPPTDGPDPEESGIPALFTYLAQFIDHDITFDPASSLQAQDDPDALTDFRTPAFDLDNIYGRGPDDQPYMYDTERQNFSPRRSAPTATNSTPPICRVIPPVLRGHSSAIRATTKTPSSPSCKVSSTAFTIAS